jgi:hypothetical protein
LGIDDDLRGGEFVSCCVVEGSGGGRAFKKKRAPQADKVISSPVFDAKITRLSSAQKEQVDFLKKVVCAQQLLSFFLPPLGKPNPINLSTAYSTLYLWDSSIML